MKIALSQINTHIGNFSYNFSKIKYEIEKAEIKKIDLLIFPELSICGYPPKDFLEYESFVDTCEKYINEVAKLSNKIAIIIGAPSKNKNNKGKKLFNSAFFLYNGKIQDIIHKTLLPDYDVFDEYRYFEPNRDFKCINFKGRKIAVTICEDIWITDNVPLYVENPLEHLIKENPEFLVNIAASPFSYNQISKRKEVLQQISSKYKIPVFYCNCVGGQTDLLFDGGSMVYDSKGRLVTELNYFSEDFKVFDLNELKLHVYSKYIPYSYSEEELIYNALKMGIKDFFAKQNFQKAIIGLSGGIDSAVTLVIAAKALGSEKILALLMPSMFSSKSSIDDSVELAENVGCFYKIIPINDIYDSFIEILEPHFKGTDFGIAEENIQARIRAVILMAFSNKFGYILLNTSNKSEIATGYGTLYGDMCGAISVLGDVYKTTVYKLANYINSQNKIIPQSIIDKVPSAELKPNQKDSDSLPEYDILDQILYMYIEEAKSFDKILEKGFDRDVIKKVINLVNNNEYKRYQAPPILRVSPRSFGSGRRMPITANYNYEG